MDFNLIQELITSLGFCGLCIILLYYIFKIQKDQSKIIEENTKATQENCKVNERMLALLEKHLEGDKNA